MKESSKLVFGYLTEQEARAIRNLVETLDENGIPSEYYHVGGYAEEAACIEKTDGGWIVYMGERGNRYELTTHETVDSACKCLLNHVAESDEQYEKMDDEFENKCLIRERIRYKQFPVAISDCYVSALGPITSALEEAGISEAIKKAVVGAAPKEVSITGMVGAAKSRAVERALVEMVRGEIALNTITNAVKAKESIERAKRSEKSKAAKPVKPH